MGRYGRFDEAWALGFLERLIPLPDTGCLEWDGALTSDGYGNVWWRGQNMMAHAVAWEIATGKAPTKLLLHKCDHPPCCNVAHLREGSPLENVADMRAKGRAVDPPHPCGEKHPSAVLSRGDVRAIRRRYATGESQERLARVYGVSQARISQIVNRKGRTCDP